jgi:hypothetical protein
MAFYTNTTLIELGVRCQCPNNYMAKMNKNMDKEIRCPWAGPHRRNEGNERKRIYEESLNGSKEKYKFRAKKSMQCISIP